MIIHTQRVYEVDETNKKNPHFLVDRIWPRGIKKTDIEITAWLKDAAPSNELRKWFNHDPDKWEEFQLRYFAELDDKPESLAPIFELGKTNSVVLLYGARDKVHNQAVALKTYLEARSKPKKRNRAAK
jgi:uncharacterized protein YeaO (DUF488 family)